MKITFAPEGSLIEFTPSMAYFQKFHTKRFTVGGSEYCFYVNRAKTVSHVRGEIAGFSIRSRSRLNKKIAMIKKHHVPLFVTLTYGDEYPTDFQAFKMNIHYFFIYLRLAFPDYGAIWKLEYQDRGAPHFHLLLWNVPIDQRDAIVDIWYKIAGFEDEKVYNFHMGRYGNEHCVQQIRSWAGVVSYASKYFTKLDDDKTRGGRVWGCRGKVPYSALIEFKVNLDQALAFRSALALARHYEFKRLGFWTNDYSVEWLLLLNNIMGYFDTASCPEDFPNWHLDDPTEFDDEDIQFS